MAKNKLTLSFDGMEEMIKALEEAEADVKKETENALSDSRNIITTNLEKAIGPHRFTGETEGSLARNEEVKWEGTTASLQVGFDIGHGGLASIFLMYGTPKMAPDRRLYNAIYGSGTKKKVAEAQRKAFEKALERLMK